MIIFPYTKIYGGIIMPIRSNIKTQPVSWIITNDKNNKLNKNISIQRREVWDAERKSNLIASLLLDVPIESLLFEESEKRSFNVLDGKQRVLTLCSFVSNGFPLSPKMRIKEFEGEELPGKTFEDLSGELQSRILDYNLSISMLTPLDADSRAVVFYMRNQAVPLSKADLLPVILGNDAMQDIAALCQHPFITGKVKLTKPAINKRDDLKIMLYYLILKSDRDLGFSGVELLSFSDEIKHGDIKIDLNEVNDLLDYLDSAIAKRFAFMKLVNTPAIMRVGQTALQSGMSPEEFGDRINNFFLADPIDPAYQETLRGGSAKRVNVQQRLKVLMGILDG